MDISYGTPTARKIPVRLGKRIVGAILTDGETFQYRTTGGHRGLVFRSLKSCKESIA
jgi:hypothetical protein